MKRLRGERRSKNNPWEILVVAGLFFVPGVFMLVQDHPIIAMQQSFRWTPSTVTVISKHGARVFGSLAIGASVVLVWFYFYLRRAIARDNSFGKRRCR